MSILNIIREVEREMRKKKDVWDSNMRVLSTLEKGEMYYTLSVDSRKDYSEKHLLGNNYKSRSLFQELYHDMEKLGEKRLAFKSKSDRDKEIRKRDLVESFKRDIEIKIDTFNSELNLLK